MASPYSRGRIERVGDGEFAMGSPRDDCMSAMNEFAIGETMLARLLHVVPECSDSVIMTIPL